ncbi:SDR family oxidoreductase [Hydrocarboniphaga sp.]|uniref:SDR family oxidoreductase n=1 Tax=Hydrocarboniphaga sp. TaxID=2033016 RepID=UPI003D0EF4CF
MNRLQHKTAIVTAAGQGIGRATAELFVREGARVIALDINQAALATLEGCRTHRVDVCDADAVATLGAQFGAVDVLVNAVGYVHSGTILDCEPADLQRSFDINVASMHLMCRSLLPAMIARGGGAIVNVSSVASSIKGVPNRFAYTTTKAAVIGLTKAIAADFVGSGIRCNAIAPGTVQSPSLDQRLAASGDHAAMRAAFIARQPMGRLGSAEEVAELALYLASDASSFTTGAVHVIDGGWTT